MMDNLDKRQPQNDPWYFVHPNQNGLLICQK